MKTQQAGTALVFADDYYPGEVVWITARLPASTTVDILNGPDDAGVPVIGEPSDYSGYLVTYAFAPGSRFGLLFARRYLERDRRFRLGTDATVFSAALRLLEVTLVPVRDETEAETETGT